VKRLLIVYASGTAGTARLAQAVAGGAHSEAGIDVQLRQARDAGPDDLRAADALVIATPENFGYMAGTMKDFFDRSFYPCEHAMAGRAYAIVICAGNDGRFAAAAVERIITGLRMRAASAPMIVTAPPQAADLDAAFELGATLAAGLALGVL
jgi:multimeric flavodoxin WrbA